MAGFVVMATERIRGRRRVRIRRLFLMDHPLCVRCESRGVVRPATQVDHIVPLFKGGEESDENRQALCDPCHADKTREDLGQREKTACGGDGIPTRLNHHWN